MKCESPLFTVIIPCKNRASYLHHTLRTCMMQNYENLEVLVSDDASTDNTREVVEDASRLDSRIRYIKPSSGTGMSHNFEYALQQVKPGFVMALGGDDGLLPDGIKGMRDTLLDTSMDLLSWSAPRYVYPNVNGANGQLSIRCFRGTKIVDSKQFLSRQAKKLHYISDFESPMFYVKGVVSTKLVDRVRKRSEKGNFYSCSTPDGYSGIVLAGEVSHYAFSGKPFSIYGSSPDSQGIVYMSNEEKAKKASTMFFQNVLSRPMHRELASQPYSPLITLMTVDYLLTARDLPGWPGSFPPINYRQVLLKGIKELASGLYGDERICRELSILNRIAEEHGLSGFFRKKVKQSKRYRKRPYFEGNGIYPGAFFVDGKAYNFNNIFDAAYAAQYLYQAYADMNVASLFSVVSKSIMYRLHAMKKGTSFPPESEWVTDTDLELSERVNRAKG
jgi:glycosyltransferase involved in cell wall biosynthesis